MLDLDRLALLISKPKYFEYFFKKLDDPNMFDWVNNTIHAFDNIPEPQLTDDGQYVQFYTWWPGKYLIKVANKIPDKVYGVIKKVHTDNRLALYDCAQAIVNMPNEFVVEKATEIISLFDNWLSLKQPNYIHNLAIDLFNKYLNINYFEGSCNILDILSKTNKGETGEANFRYAIYEYEIFIKKSLPKLIETKPLMVLYIIINNLKKALTIEMESKQAKNDGSIIWRPAVEENPQNWFRENPKVLFLEILQDILNQINKNNPGKTKEIIKILLEEHFSIFKRLAINSIRIFNYHDLAESILTDKRYMEDTDIHHEYYLLVKETFAILDLDRKKQFISWIIEGPARWREEKDEEYLLHKKSWQARKYSMIKEYIEKDDYLKEYKAIFNELKGYFEADEHPDFLMYHSSWTGPTSSLTKEQIKELSPEEFIEWIKYNIQPPFEPTEPTPTGVARLLEEIVKEIPQPYANVAEKFLDEKVWPTYLSHLFMGFEDAIKNGKSFNLEPIIKTMEHPIKFHNDPELTYKHDEFDIGQYSWFRGTISNLIEALVNNDDISLTDDILDRTQRVLIELIEKEVDPTDESEEKYGPKARNMDYVSYCINSNRGKAMHALICHALRRARNRPEQEKKLEEGKGPFPPGRRMELYKDFLEKRIDEERSPSVQSSYGKFLSHLYYLDQEWVQGLIGKGKLFPKLVDKINFWEAHWQGYIGFNKFYEELFLLLKGEYQNAINLLVTDDSGKNMRNSYTDRLAAHLMIAYWKKLEDIRIDKSLIDLFFEKASADLKGHALWFLGNALEEVKPQKDTDDWKRLKEIWKYRVAISKDNELGYFVRWLKYCPEDLDDIVDLIKPIIPFVYRSYEEEELLEYINDKIESNPYKGILLLNEILKQEGFQSHFMGRFDTLIREILTKAKKYKEDGRITRSINEAVNRLGKLGLYEFRDLLV